VVEYEALYYQPVDTLTRLTNAIYPVARDCIERAIESCNIREMRATAQDNRAFFRQGSYGGWRQVLPPDLVDFLRTTEPYPAQFAALGYTLDAQDKWSAAAAKRVPAKAGFFEQFGHSPATTSLLKSIYLSFDTDDAQRRWPDIAQASVPTSFHAWLNQPADADPGAPGAGPMITNIAAQIHRLRTHLSTSFPDLYGRDRADFCSGSLSMRRRPISSKMPTSRRFATRLPSGPPRHGRPRWIRTTRRIRWRAPQAERADVPGLTYLARYIYRRRPNLRAIFPDVYGQHRIEYMRWFLGHAASEYSLDQACIAPLRQAFTAWATRPSAQDPARHPKLFGSRGSQAGLPVLTNLAVYIYDRRADLHTIYPDLYGQHRIDIVRWMIAHAVTEFNIEPAWIEPLRQAFADWATQLDSHDPAARAWRRCERTTFDQSGHVHLSPARRSARGLPGSVWPAPDRYRALGDRPCGGGVQRRFALGSNRCARHLPIGLLRSMGVTQPRVRATTRAYRL